MDAAMIHHRSCHPTPEASPLAVGEAGYGWIGMVVSRLVRPSDCLLGYGPCSPSRATVLFAAASGGAGWAASAQPCRCTLPAMLSSRRAFAGVGFGGLWRSPHVAPPWPRASACPSFGFAGAVRTAVPWQFVPAIFASGFERAVLFSMLSAGEVRTAGTVAFQAPSTIARFSFRRAFFRAGIAGSGAHATASREVTANDIGCGRQWPYRGGSRANVTSSRLGGVELWPPAVKTSPMPSDGLFSLGVVAAEFMRNARRRQTGSSRPTAHPTTGKQRIHVLGVLKMQAAVRKPTVEHHSHLCSLGRSWPNFGAPRQSTPGHFAPHHIGALAQLIALVLLAKSSAPALFDLVNNWGVIALDVASRDWRRHISWHHLARPVSPAQGGAALICRGWNTSPTDLLTKWRHIACARVVGHVRISLMRRRIKLARRYLASPLDGDGAGFLVFHSTTLRHPDDPRHNVPGSGLGITHQVSAWRIHPLEGGQHTIVAVHRGHSRRRDQEHEHSRRPDRDSKRVWETVANVMQCSGPRGRPFSSPYPSTFVCLVPCGDDVVVTPLTEGKVNQVGNRPRRRSINEKGEGGRMTLDGRGNNITTAAEACCKRAGEGGDWADGPRVDDHVLMLFDPPHPRAPPPPPPPQHWPTAALQISFWCLQRAYWI